MCQSRSPFWESPVLSFDHNDEAFPRHKRHEAGQEPRISFFTATSHTFRSNLPTTSRHFLATPPSTRISSLHSIMTSFNNQSIQSERFQPNLSFAGSTGSMSHPEQTEYAASSTRSTDFTSLIRPPQTHPYSSRYMGRGEGSGSQTGGTGASFVRDPQSAPSNLPPNQPFNSSSSKPPPPTEQPHECLTPTGVYSATGDSALVMSKQPVDLASREYHIKSGTRATPVLIGPDHDRPQFVRWPSADGSAAVGQNLPAQSFTRDGRSDREPQDTDQGSRNRQRRRSCRGLMGALGASLAGASQIFVGVNCFGG
jgi:hypothetical protein